MKYSTGRKFQTVIWSRPDSFSAGAYSGICPGGLNFLSFRGGLSTCLGPENILKSIDFTGPHSSPPPPEYAPALGSGLNQSYLVILLTD